jgi:peroxiredoxin
MNQIGARVRNLIRGGVMCSCLASATAWAQSVDDELAPDFVLKSIAGPNLRLSEYRGEVIMLAFWASWCGDCRSQLEAFDALYDTYESVGFEMFGVSLDSERRQVTKAVESLNLRFPVLHDKGGGVARLYDVDDVPYVVFIDREGRLRHTVHGFDHFDRDAFAERLRELLRE